MTRADVPALVAGALAGQPRALGRLISLVENGGDELADVARSLQPHTGRAHVVGVTGAPGVGKSTSTSALVTVLRERDRRVGVLAVDPSSPFSGGALLGDRVRMGEHSIDDGVFIRSMASRGHLGGLAAAAPQAVRVLDAAGFDVVVVETVGVGQAELEVATLADTTVVLLAPGMGDGIQAAKAGIIEIADVFVVNKADRDGATQVARELRQLQEMTRSASGWRAPIVTTVAARGEGVPELLAAIDEHGGWLDRTGERARRRERRLAAEVEAVALAGLHRDLAAARGSQAFADVLAVAAAGDVHAAADRLRRSL